jgi:hypothetical protein
MKELEEMRGSQKLPLPNMELYCQQSERWKPMHSKHTQLDKKIQDVRRSGMRALVLKRKDRLGGDALEVQTVERLSVDGFRIFR